MAGRLFFVVLPAKIYQQITNIKIISLSKKEEDKEENSLSNKREENAKFAVTTKIMPHSPSII